LLWYGKFKWAHSYLFGRASRTRKSDFSKLERIPLTTIANAAVLDSIELVHGYVSDNGTVHRLSDKLPVGKVDEPAMECLLKISDEQDTDMQVMLSNSNSPKGTRRGHSRKTGTVGWISVIIYGPADLAEDIGDFLDKCGYYLQDPYGCDRVLPYENPHCISTPGNGPQLTSMLPTSLNAPSDTLSVPDSLLALQSTNEFLEMDQPEGIDTKLTR
jgi:hypothetical protein